MLEAMSVLVATELVVALRALRMAGRVPTGSGVQALYAAASEIIAAGTEDRAFGQDVAAAGDLLRKIS